MIYDEDKRIYSLPEVKYDFVEKEKTIAAYLLERHRLLIMTKCNSYIFCVDNDGPDGW